MSELIHAQRRRRNYRRYLTVTASAMALASLSAGALADDADRPIVWVDLGGQLEGLSDFQEPYVPPFLSNIAQYGIRSPLGVEKPPHYGFATEGAISFEPENSGWVFSASVLYGRSLKNKSSHQQTPNARLPDHVTLPASFGGEYINAGTRYPSSHVKFSDASAQQSDRHIILDFDAGKDVGLGMFGAHASSTLSAGIRFAQFSSQSQTRMHMEPDVQYPTAPITGTFSTWARKRIAFYNFAMHFHDDAGMETDTRSFHGIGPALKWNASAPFAGESNSGELTLDWGANAALLFGRQRVRGQHQTTVRTYYKHGSFGVGRRKVGFIGHAFATVSVAQHSQSGPFSRERIVAVPNVGGFAGISFQYSDAKIGLGYRADLFFGAMDGGIDTRKTENVGFYGPFATISVGLGG
jgi:hypothetical protein